MSWSHIDKLLERLNRISTVFGKYWISTLIILRLLLLSAFGRGIWSEESKDFSCNTKQPGCTNICFNAFTPVSHIRLWELQVLAVSLPIIAFMVYVGYLEDKSKTKKKDTKKSSKKGDDDVFAGDREVHYHKGEPDKHHRRWTRLKSYVVDENKQSKVDTRKIWKLYVVQCTIRTLVDVAFVFVQLNTYVYKWEVPIVYLCSLWPCPHTVDCFISRPKEKSLFLQYMFISAGISILLGIFEIIHILVVYSRKKKAKKQQEKRESPRYVSTPSRIPPSYSGTPNGMTNGKLVELSSLPLPKHILAGAAGAAIGGAMATSFPFPSAPGAALPRKNGSFSDDSNFGAAQPFSDRGDSDDSRIHPHRTRRRQSQLELEDEGDQQKNVQPSAPPQPVRTEEPEPEEEPEEDQDEDDDDDDDDEDDEEEEAGGGDDSD